MQYEVKILNNLLEFINSVLESNQINSDINQDIRCFACQFEPEIKVMIRCFAEEIEDILYENKNDDCESIEEFYEDDYEEKIIEITDNSKKNKIINHLYELKSFAESTILDFQKGNKRIWSMA